jgi:hypothetical protein
MKTVCPWIVGLIVLALGLILCSGLEWPNLQSHMGRVSLEAAYWQMIGFCLAYTASFVLAGTMAGLVRQWLFPNEVA